MGIDYLEIVMKLEENFDLPRYAVRDCYPLTVGALFDCVWAAIEQKEPSLPGSQKRRKEDVWIQVCEIILKTCGNTMDVRLVTREMRLIEDLGME
jgi:hypothetical protein